MKSITKRLLALSLILCLSVALFGCSNTAERKHSKHFTVFIHNSADEPAKDNKILAKIKEDLGYEFTFEYLVGNLEEKIGVMIAGSDYPDIIGVSGTDTRLIEAGALIPLNEYITEEKTPNLYKHMEPIMKKASFSGDGNLYVFPNYNRFYGEPGEGAYNGAAFWIQKAVLEEFGYPTPKTLDDYFGLIRDYAKKYPTINGMKTIGFEILAATGSEFCLTNAPAQLAGYPNDGGVVVNPETYEAEFYNDDEIAKKYYKYLNQVNDEGLIDPEAFTQTKDQYLAKLASGRVLGMYDQHWNFATAEDSLLNQGLIERQYVPFPITYEGVEPYYRDRPVLNINEGFGISVNCANPEEVINMFETLLSEEWQKIFNWGFEGEDYLVDENGRLYRTPEMREEQGDLVWKAKNKLTAFYAIMPKIQGQYEDGNGAGPGEQPEEFYASLRDYDKNLLDKYGVQRWVDFMNDPPENPVYYPAWQIVLEDGSEAQLANAGATDISIKYLPKLITVAPSKFDGLWKEYVSELSKKNIKAYEDRINEQIQWRLENWK